MVEHPYSQSQSHVTQLYQIKINFTFFDRYFDAERKILLWLLLKESEIESAYNAYYNKEEVDDRTNVFAEIENLLAEKKAQLAESNRTARLWVQLSEYIDTILPFIRSERLGDWEMHLAATHRMMNLFTATGHFHFAKSARFYLQQMLDLPSKHPAIWVK